MVRYLFSISLFTIISLAANDVSQVAKELNLFAGTKATAQWERIFSSQRRMKEYQLDTLSSEKIKELKIYLIKHAADSDQPVVPGL